MGSVRNRIDSIQFLRAVAALAVVITHVETSTYWLARHGYAPFERTGISGAWGVDLFFVISGFVMVHASAGLYGRPGARSLFLKRRLIRIVPLYWLVTLTFAAWIWRTEAIPDPAHLASSLAFLPFDSGRKPLHFVPLVEPGWTLNFEMLFYLLFALFLARTARMTVILTGAALLGLVMLGPLTVDRGAILFSWTRPIMLEFLGGMVLALIHRRGLVLPVAARLLVVVLAAAIFLAKPDGAFDHWHSAERLLFWGLPSILVVGGAVLGPLRLPGAPLWRPLGDASYSIYLWHLPMLAVFFFLWRHFRLPFDPLAYAAFMLACAILSGLASYYLFERPVTRWLNQRFAKGSDLGPSVSH